MDILYLILLKILPLHICNNRIHSGKYLNIEAKGIGKLIIYIIAPFVIFGGYYTFKIIPEHIYTAVNNILNMFFDSFYILSIRKVHI